MRNETESFKRKSRSRRGKKATADAVAEQKTVLVGAGTLEPTPPVLTSPEVDAQIAQFGARYPFELDQFQRDAIATLIHSESALVAAPTGTGKTVVAEFGVYDTFRRSGRVFYTTPIKALSNQKYRDLRQTYGDEVGLLTGDVSENREARLMVMTTEILRNMLLQTPWELDAVDCVIFDEVHYLADQERGTTWEEAIILCPEHVQLICLSATVSNADEIAGWITRTHRPIRLITHLERSVPLSLYYFIDGQMQQVVDHHGHRVKDFPNAGGEARKQANRGNGRHRRRTEFDEPGMDEPQPHEIIDRLGADDMLPAIYFLFSRNDCQVQAERLAAMRPHMVTPLQEQMIASLITAYLASLRPEDRELEQVQLITTLARRGVAFHHAGLLPLLKQLVEVLFSRGLLNVVFATDTLALGVNMPARSVVIGRMTKWDGRRRRILLPNEFQQMAGRAGRRGMDTYGHVVVPYSPWITFPETMEVATGPLEPVRSAFAVRYNTVLSLWDPPAGDRVLNLLHQSLAQYQSSQRIRQLEDDIIEIGGDLAGVPAGCLIGLPGGDELLLDYYRLQSTVSASAQRTRRTQDALRELSRSAGTTAWAEPSRQALMRHFRNAEPGDVVHHRNAGWMIFLGRAKNAVGVFLTREGMQLLQEYREIDHLIDHSPIKLPNTLGNPGAAVPIADLITKRQLQEIWKRVEKLELPDLELLRAEHDAREAERRQRQLEEIELEIQESMAQSDALTAALDNHPCHACERRLEHEHYLRQRESLDVEQRLLEEIHEVESEAEMARIRGVMRGIREVLHRFGYLHRGFPTAKADMLAGVFDTDGLILCEMVDRGLLDRLPPEDLAEVFSWFSFDRDYRYANHFTLPDRLISMRERLEEIERAVLGEERDNKLFVSEGHNPTFYGAARAWSRGQPMLEITRQIELSEGDLVMTFNKTLDLMRQVREMLQDVRPDSVLIGPLRRAEDLMMRDIVEQSLMLGFAPVDLVEQAMEHSDAIVEVGPTDAVAIATAPPRRRRAKRVTPA